MQDYHKITGRISNSSLNLLEKSPRMFKKFLDGESENENTSYYDFGTAMHMYVLEPEEFKKQVVVIEYTVPKSAQQKKFCTNFITYRKSTKKKLKIQDAAEKAYTDEYKQVKDWEEKAISLYKALKPYIRYLIESENKLVLTPKIYKKIKDIGKMLEGHEIASKLLTDPFIIDDGIDRYNELQILWEYKGIKCKSMLDRILVDKENKVITIVDLKSTANLIEFENSFKKYKYDRQLVYYGTAVFEQSEKLFNLTKEEIEIYKVELIIIAIDKTYANIRVFKLSQETVNKAFSEMSSLLNKALWHIDNNKWDYPMEYYIKGEYELL